MSSVKKSAGAKASPKKSARSASKRSRELPEPSVEPQGITFRCRGRPLPGAREAVAKLLARGKLEEARIHDRTNRESCGEDLGPVIAALPQDGQSHEFECPRCKMTHHATPPAPETAGEASP